ncbi:hypothetical protein K493DRAFT_366970 [Basidiobolus meristosporus CBS 931.73]|uniref:Arrestin C-terminal-like domain-containing protein n=1 Tax=Basidiobolus meristosporus CBS 931.73 TaxID=1314790 RepID=A0A1Y1ZAT2_9FUNG|nr:hypothetical protein K493DRAFT_366970 [Basidiobolus meristosporus CBS 931.73]|eukprot:ORY07107.1 hypothetical protein K493DRAFT_366970 [Basidiobolus meristosporus CBS 931.73]
MIYEEILQVRLNNEVVVMHGSPEDSVGSVVSGFVLFTPSKSIKVRYICLKLQGTLSLENSQELYGAYRTLTQDKLLLLGPGIGYHCFEAQQQYRFDFELPLKGSLPETVEVPYGRILYQVSVTVVRPFPFTNIRRHRSFRVERVYLPTEVPEISNHSSGIWGKFIYYHISVPQAIATIGNTLTITAKYVFKSYSLKLDKISLRLMEITTYRHPTTMIETYECTQLARGKKNFSEMRSKHELCIRERITIKIPTLSGCNCETNFISVSHKLMVKTRFIGNDNRKWSAMVEIPVVLQSPIQHELSCSPPRYSNISAEFFGATPPPAYESKETITCTCFPQVPNLKRKCGCIFHVDQTQIDGNLAIQMAVSNHRYVHHL